MTEFVLKMIPRLCHKRIFPPTYELLEAELARSINLSQEEEG